MFFRGLAIAIVISVLSYGLLFVGWDRLSPVSFASLSPFLRCGLLVSSPLAAAMVAGAIIAPWISFAARKTKQIC